MGRTNMRDAKAIPELSTVVLRRRVESKGDVLPEGRRGTVVHAWGDGQHYAVEFTEPRSQVVDVERGDITLA
jgi:hypothetical protein